MRGDDRAITMPDALRRGEAVEESASVANVDCGPDEQSERLWVQPQRSD